MAPPCCMPPDGMSSVFCSAESAIGAIEAIDMHGHYGPTGELLLRNGTCPPHHLHSTRRLGASGGLLHAVAACG